MGNCNNNGESYAKSTVVDETSNEVVNSWHDGSILGMSATYNYSNGIPFVTCSDDKRVASQVNDPIKYITTSPAAAIEGKGNDVRYGLGHTKAVNRVIASNRFIWSVSRDLSMRQWNHNGDAIQVFNDLHTMNISAVAVRTDESSAFTGSRDYHVKEINIETNATIQQYSAPRNIVTFLEHSAEKELLFQGAEDLSVRIWDTRSSAKSSSPAIHLTSYVYFPLCGSLNHTGSLLATGCKGFNGVGCEMKIWDMRSSKLLHEFTGIHEHDVTGCRFIPGSDRYVVTASKDGHVCIYDVHTSSLAASTSTDKNFTSLCVTSTCASMVDDVSYALVQMMAGAFDGSVSIFTWDMQAQASTIRLLAATKAAFQECDVKGYNAPAED